MEELNEENITDKFVTERLRLGQDMNITNKLKNLHYIIFYLDRENQKLKGEYRALNNLLEDTMDLIRQFPIRGLPNLEEEQEKLIRRIWNNLLKIESMNNILINNKEG